ncbi:uncharacterized protein Bfra_010924 [Botrytis fragariae]|uniref:Uncharacterized protein n=1 Tax=Botrytis fragariae TaxID=1964551 RepID=A0A8H6ALQ0_9HELO|nr:uncharacterized protein Bfra_010924 [Botrytis fragariae]KAF5869724.1 hypothetical protein Bfra_010924 [Botrytis fragariae]
MATISEISLPPLENILEGHSVDIDTECFHDSPKSTHPLSPGRRGILVAIILFECFFAPVNIFVFLLWLLLFPVGLILSTGMNSLGILDITDHSGARSGTWMLYTHVLLLLVDSSDIFNSSSSMDSDNPGLWTRS